MDIKLGVCKYNNNSGVTCYINSILAILQQTPYFADYILSDNYTLNNSTNENIINSVIFQLFKIFKISLSNDDKQLTINTFRSIISKKNMMWGEFQHQDSQEFLTFLLNTIEEEIKEKVVYLPGRKIENKKVNIENLIALKNWEIFTKKEHSIIKQLFTGQNQSIIICEKCKYKKNHFDIFQNLQLGITDKCTNIYDCLDAYTQEEQLDIENRIWCNFCFLKNKAFKRNQIWRPPKILIINFKRFKYNEYGMITSKNTQVIEYPIDGLDINKYISENSPYKNKCKYNLFGINLHKSMGGSNNLNFGHYTSIIKNRYNNKWYIFDDNNVSPACLNIIVNSNAYLLFYLREN